MDDPRMTIGELAAATGLSRHALRYYEREDLIPPAERNAAGHRRYRAEYVRWISLLERLKTSGMPIARMREYSQLVRRGDATREARRSLLERHEGEIRARIRELERCLEIVEAKIALYDGRLDDPSVVWDLIAEAQGDRRVSVPRKLRTA